MFTMLRSALVVFTLLVTATVTVNLPAGFDPAHWPGEKPPSAEYKTLTNQLREAQKQQDVARVRQVVAEIRKDLGVYAGVPQVKPEYGTPIERTEPDLKAAEAICWKSFDFMRGSTPWDLAGRAKPGEQPRLRVTTRIIVSDLRAFEAGGPHSHEYLDTAVQGMNYLVSQQASTGVFGYPYDPNAKEGIKAQVATLVHQGESRGLKMTEGPWLIEDFQDGGLQFDNGEAGAALLYGYALTGNRKYLEAARKAADWALGRPIVPNWNYNSYSAYLLARMYRVTGERKYLDAAITKFEVGVLPGQMENGRWVDQHNARPQYHALMTRNLVEYTLALEQAKDPLAAEARRHTRLALDSMAEEQNRYGASNAEEGLPLEALAAGLMAFGPTPEWEDAANIQVNYAVNHLLPNLIGAWPKRGQPATLTAYVLWRQVKDHDARSCEISIDNCVKK